MSQKHRLGELQIAIMQVLWDRKEASASEVHAALHDERGLAPTTIATMLRKMEDKGVVTHRTEGRQFLYRARVREADVRRTMVSDLVDRLFEGDPLELVSHLLDDKQIDAAELQRIREKLEAGRAARRGGPKDKGPHKLRRKDRG